MSSKTRIPPRPATYDSAKPGQCRFCSKPVFRGKHINKRAQWHASCALTWTIMNSPQDARRFVFIRDRGMCARCGVDCSPRGQEHARQIVSKLMQGYEIRKLGLWELDHIVPLFAADGNPDMWKLPNLQSLCPPCHLAKGREDEQTYPRFQCL